MSIIVALIVSNNTIAANQLAFMLEVCGRLHFFLNISGRHTRACFPPTLIFQYRYMSRRLSGESTIAMVH